MTRGGVKRQMSAKRRCLMIDLQQMMLWLGHIHSVPGNPPSRRDRWNGSGDEGCCSHGGNRTLPCRCLKARLLDREFHQRQSPDQVTVPSGTYTAKYGFLR